MTVWLEIGGKKRRVELPAGAGGLRWSLEARHDFPRRARPLGAREPLRRWVDVRARQLEAVEQAEEELAEPGQRRRVIREARFVVPTRCETLQRLDLGLDRRRTARTRLLLALFGKADVDQHSASKPEDCAGVATVRLGEGFLVKARDRQHEVCVACCGKVWSHAIRS